MDGMAVAAELDGLPRSWVKREMPLLNRAQMDDVDVPLDGGGSGDIIVTS